MNPYPADYWNEFYSAEEFMYGTTPNEFFRQQLDLLEPGNILLPADGEGRNAVYAASQGWKVTAFDMSVNGQKKALQLAQLNRVSIDYQVCSVLEFESEIQFDVIGFSYAHFPIDIRRAANQHLLKFLKKDGTVIFEAFAKAQLGKSSGGPQNIEMLFSIVEIQSEFSALDFKSLKEETIELAEGKKHVGEARVIRFVGMND
jgi:SAM-dependent methyltransferase